MNRTPLIVANFKLHFVRAELRAWCEAFVAGLAEPWASTSSVETGVAPSATLLATAADALAGRAQVFAQDVSAYAKGAFTGEVSAAQVLDAGGTGSLIGHSERRHGHGETDAQVRSKIDTALAGGLTALVCVGETLAQREAGQTDAVVLAQVDAALTGLPSLDRVRIAYEPVWAIGTGRVAEPSDAQAVHGAIRRRVAELHGEAANRLRILYGGSVKPDNAAALLSQPDIDGALVGGASLDVAAFLRIVRASQPASPPG